MAGLASTPAFGQQGPTGTGPSFTARPGRKYVPDHVLVRFRPGLPAEARASSHAQLGGDVLRRYRSVPGLELVKIPAGLRVREAIRVYKNNPNILYAEPDYIVRALETTPNDTSFTTLWAMKNTGQSGGTVDADIDATNAWDLSTGSTSVVVGVIDTGVDFNHPDLVGNIFNNLPECTGTPGVDDDDNDYVDDCLGINPSYREPDPFDDNNHGTHVSGTIGARGNNAVGVVGVNWQVKILACKFLNVDGFGSDSNAIACLDYMAMMKDRGVNIVATNNSWGGGGFSLALYEAIQAQMNRGILFIAAAGNGGADSIGDDNDVGEEFPANFDLPNIISVAATSRTDALGSFSNFGRHTVHLGAPGVAILSTTPNNFYQSFDGTSMATPHVTGAAALLKAQNPALDWIAIKNRILAGGDTKPAVSNTISQKRLNVFGAMTCSNKVLLTPLRPARSTTTAAVGAPVTLAALHINCAAPNGNVAVTVSPGGGTVTLLDNGNAPDQVAGDGIYSGQWVPSAAGSYTLGFPNGNNATVIVLRPYNSGPTSFSYRNITGTNLNLGDDQTAQVTPGFSILFGGTSFSKVFVSSNGLVSLDGAFDSFINEALPVSRANTIVAPWWDDLMPQPGTSQNVFWAVTGSTPNRQLVVEWRNVPHFSFSPVLSETVKFQTVFFENKSDILFNYADVTFGGDSALSDQGSSATVGVQVSGTEANEFSFETPTLSDNSAILWQNSPGYNILISDSSQSIYPGQTAVYHGTLSFNNGYVGTVSLLCASGSTSVPSKCSVSPASLSGSGDITITVSDSALQDFNFNVHAIGNDANQVTNDVPLMLHVADFIFQDLIPSSFDLPDGTTSNAIGAQMVSAPGSAFTDIVSVSCGSGLPPGATCTFFPALVDMNTPVSPHQAHFSISLGPSTPLGTYNVTVLADSAGAPAPKQKTLTINVTANPDFVLRSTPPRFDLVRGGSVTATVGNVQQDGFNSAVDLSCFALSAGVSCSFATNPMPANGTSAVTLSVSSSATDSSSIKIQGSASGKSHDLYVGYQLLDFVPSATPTTASVPVGKSASYTVGMIPTPSFGFVVPMTVGCTGLAAGMTCSASPASITPGVTSTVTVTTTVGVTPVATNNFSITGTAQGVTKTTSVQLTTTDPPLKAVSVTPSSGTGSSQTFAFLYSHTGGADKISYVQALINATNSWQKACAILYIRSANQLYLVLDNGSGWQGPLTPGQAGTLQNTQCTLNAGTSSVSAVGNNLTVNAALSFKPAFSGNKVVLLDAEDTVNHLSSGFQSLGTWTVPAAAPTAVSVTPNAGTGSSQTFSFLFSDASGANKISYVQALINSSNSWQKACAVLYIQNGNKLYLVLDNGTGWQGPLTPGVAGTLQNTQCTLNAGASSVSAVGNNLTVNAALSFKPAFGGNKVVLLDAEDTINHLSSGFQSLGTWTVPVSAPTAVSVTPSSGSGTTQTFSFLYSDAGGVGRITYAQALINSSHSWRNACAILYIQNGNKLYLVLDSGTGWQGPVTPGVAGTLENTQCTLNAGASSVSAVGNNLTVNAALSFKPAFGGSKVVLLDAEDIPGNLSSGFQSLGAWTVPVSAPTAVSVTPSSGTGSSQTFAFLYSDAGGVGRITYAQALINSSNSWRNACAILYMQNGNKLYLVLDSGTGWQGPLTPGVAGTLENTQCTLDAGASSVSAVGNNLTVNAALSFKPAFSGSKVVLLDAEDRPNNLSSGFQTRGSWSVPNSTPSITSISPTSIPALSGDTVLTVNGSSFLASSAVELSGLSLTTTFQSSSQLTATIPASMLTNPGSVPITVQSPAPGGGVSNAMNLTIAQAVTVSPSTRTVPVNWTRQFTATVSGETNQSVTWMVNGVAGGEATNGIITATGIYISPGTVPGNDVVTVKAVSVADPNKYGTAVVTITLPVSDNYPRSDPSSILDTAPAVAQVPLQGTLVAVLDWTSKDSSGTEEEVFAACHSLVAFAIPHVHTTDWATAATYPFVVVAGVVAQNRVDDSERDAVQAYVDSGGTLLLWRTEDTGLLSRLGISSSATFSGTTQRDVTFNVPNADGALRYIDDDVEIQWQLQYPGPGVTREYSPGTAAVLATWQSGQAAILRADVGTGRAYVFGWRLRNVLSEAERQVIPGVEGSWVNTLKIDADIMRLLARAIYESYAGPEAHVRQPAPDGKPAALILTHDVDARVAYDNLPDYLALENTQGVKATYLFTTAPYDSGWVETMYTESGKANIQSALDQGFDIQSHSFDHYKDFDDAPYGTGNEDGSNYLPHYSADLGYTIGYSALGELGVSRWLLRHDFGVEVPGFRSGYLLMPVNFLSAVQDIGYRRDSTYAAGISRGFLPFVPSTVSGGNVTTYRFVEYPMGLEDRNMTADNVVDIVDSWERVIRANYKNNVPTVINIHPVNQPRLDAMQLLSQRIADLDIWIGDWKTFGDFWESQGMTCSRWP